MNERVDATYAGDKPGLSDGVLRVIALEDARTWLQYWVIRFRSNDYAQCVAAVLFNHLNNETGQLDPGQRRIAEQAKIHLRHITRTLEEMEQAGAIRRRPGRKVRGGQVVQYDLLLPECVTSSGDSTGVTSQGDSSPPSVTRSVTRSVTTGVTSRGDETIERIERRNEASDTVVSVAPDEATPTDRDLLLCELTMTLSSAYGWPEHKADEFTREWFWKQSRKLGEAPVLTELRSALDYRAGLVEQGTPPYGAWQAASRRLNLQLEGMAAPQGGRNSAKPGR
jgi:hypothetical protein